MTGQGIEVSIYLFLIFYGAIFRNTIFSRLFLVPAAIVLVVGAITVGIELSFIVIFCLLPIVDLYKRIRTRFPGSSSSDEPLGQSEAN
ncbi:hypothetical protein [Roseibium sp. LAB1]|jgi:hypothetical protein